MATKFDLGSINSALLKKKKEREEMEYIRYKLFKNLLDLKTKYNMSNQEFLDTVEFCSKRIKCSTKSKFELKRIHESSLVYNYKTKPCKNTMNLEW